MKVVATNNRSFLDIAVIAAGSIESLFESALLSGVSVHEVPEAATKLEIIATFHSYKSPLSLPVLQPIKNIVAFNGQSLADITANFDLENIFEMALLNDLRIDSKPVPGTKLKVVETPVEVKKQTPLPILRPVKKLIAVDKQNIQDLTIQTAGSLENIFEMAMLNGISVTETPTPGEKYKAVENNINSDIVNYYVAKKIIPATGLKWIPQQLFENGLFENGLFE